MKLGLLPPLGPLYLARELKDAGHTVRVIDFSAVPLAEEYLRRHLDWADAVGITLQSFNLDSGNRLIELIRAYSREIPLVVGGPDITLRPRMIKGADLCVAGEAERTVVEIFEKLLYGGSFLSIPGVIHKFNGSHRMTKEPYMEEDLDRIKFPLRTALVRESEYRLFGSLYSKRMANVLTSRGCPFQCRFCAHKAVSFKTFRMRSPSNILAELEELWKAGKRIIGIVDDTFTIPRLRALEVLEGIINKGWDFTIALQTRVDSVDEELFRKMRDAGVRIVVFGLESANGDVLRYYRKGTTLHQNRQAVLLAEKYGIVTVGDFILGAPIESEEHLRRTINFAKEIPLDLATFWALEIPYGSSLWEEALEMGALRKDEFIVTSGKERGLGYLYSWEVEQEAKEAFREFYYRPRHWLRFAKKTMRDSRLRDLTLRAFISIMRSKFPIIRMVSGVREMERG